MKKVKSTALVIVVCLGVAAGCLSVRTETSPRKIVSAAVGYAWTDGTDRDLDALLQRADEKMYKNKQKMKRKRRTIRITIRSMIYNGLSSCNLLADDYSRLF